MKTLALLFLWLLSQVALSYDETKIDPLVTATKEIIATARQGGYDKVKTAIFTKPLPAELPATKDRQELTEYRLKMVKRFADGIRDIETFLEGQPDKVRTLFSFDDVKLGAKERGGQYSVIFTFRYPQNPDSDSPPPVPGYVWTLHFTKAKDSTPEKPKWLLDTADQEVLKPKTDGLARASGPVFYLRSRQDSNLRPSG